MRLRLGLARANQRGCMENWNLEMDFEGEVETRLQQVRSVRPGSLEGLGRSRQ